MYIITVVLQLQDWFQYTKTEILRFNAVLACHYVNMRSSKNITELSLIEPGIEFIPYVPKKLLSIALKSIKLLRY